MKKDHFVVSSHFFTFSRFGSLFINSFSFFTNPSPIPSFYHHHDSVEETAANPEDEKVSKERAL